MLQYINMNKIIGSYNKFMEIQHSTKIINFVINTKVNPP